MTAPVFLARLSAEAARGERDREVHIFPEGPAGDEGRRRARCGLSFLGSDLELLESIGGAPCERCLAAQARRVRALGREVLGPPSAGRVRVRLSPSGLPQRHRGIVAPPPRELPHPIPAAAARAAAAAAVLEPAERARVAARVLDGLRALPRRIPAPRGPARMRS